MNQYRCETCKNPHSTEGARFYCNGLELPFDTLWCTSKRGCASHSVFQIGNPYAKVVGIHCPLCNWHQIVPIDEWYFQSTVGHGHTCGSNKCPSHTYMVLDDFQSERDKVLDNLKTGIIKDLIACSFVVPDYPYVRKECISLYDAEEIVKQKIGVELRAGEL
jgi:hypothetical protein